MRPRLRRRCGSGGGQGGAGGMHPRGQRSHAAPPFGRAALIQKPARQRQRILRPAIGRGAVHAVGAERRAGLDADVCRVAGQHGCRAGIDRKAELGGQGQVACGQRRRQIGGQRIGHGICKGRDQDVAARLGGDVRVDQPVRAQRRDQGRMGCGRHPAQLQVGAARQLDHAVAMGLGGIGDGLGLGRVQTSAGGADAHHPAVARLHRLQRTGAPAADHDSPAMIELRRVTHRPASCSRWNRSRIAARAAGFASCMKATISRRPRVAS